MTGLCTPLLPSKVGGTAQNGWVGSDGWLSGGRVDLTGLFLVVAPANGEHDKCIIAVLRDGDW